MEQRDNLANAAVHKVQVEIMSWLTRHVGGVGSGRIFFDQEFTPGESLKAVLTRLGHRFPELGREIWNPETGEIWEFVEIIVNDAFLGIHHTHGQPDQGRRPDYPDGSLRGRIGVYSSLPGDTSR